MEASRSGTCQRLALQERCGVAAVWPHRPRALQLPIRRRRETIEALGNEQFPLGGARVHVALTIALQRCCAVEKIGLLPHGYCHFLPLSATRYYRKRPGIGQGPDPRPGGGSMLWRVGEWQSSELALTHPAKASGADACAFPLSKPPARLPLPPTSWKLPLRARALVRPCTGALPMLLRRNYGASSALWCALIWLSGRKSSTGHLVKRPRLQRGAPR
jgi:hypothetical protein